MTEKERTIIAQTHEQFGMCLTGKDLKKDFEKLGITAGMTLLVHCSLSKLGWICGGSVTVIKVLLDLLGSDGTLIMPSHNAGNTDPKHWKNPPVPAEWFETIRQSMPGYQSSITPTRSMGQVAETFRHWPGVLRSEHPQYSVIAHGPKAKLITNNRNECCGEQSPLARLYDCKDNGYVLLLGVSHRNNTSLHLAEYRYQMKNQIEKTFINGASVFDPQTNQSQWVEWNDYDYDADDFNDVGYAYESSEESVKIGKVGLAECRLIKQYLLVDFAVNWMEKNRLQSKLT